MVSSLQPMFEEHILPLLTPVEELWQPTDFLPDPRDQEQFFHEVRPCKGGRPTVIPRGRGGGARGRGGRQS